MPRGNSTHGKADLHLHTALGDGMASLSELLEFVEHHTDLDLIAVTDHDQLESSLQARELHAKRGAYHFEMVAGTEVTTLEGHLLAIGIEQAIPSFRSLSATIDAVHRQGGMCLVPHPLSWLTRSIGRHGMERVLSRKADGLWFDGIELTNQTPAARIVATRAQQLNTESFRLPVAGGSDAHYLKITGTSYTVFPGQGFADLQVALAAGVTSAECRPTPSVAELGYGQILRQSWRGLWATPRRVLRVPQRRRSA